ncbi:E3 ubiquitin-protein ligase UPL7 [Gossypium raimondii]|uniref:E3 ubiquitin-protein ligase UPL7 n=1 Tax=Gossypium raimondii TaxID=29730 RepID=UPI00227CEAAA|nr:E3 ubiquitin-protein ligase UPL7 [Gossypium raimondii]
MQNFLESRCWFLKRPWKVMNDFEPKERCMLLKFMTSCSRAPLLGFKYLQSAFTIHKVASDAPLWAAIGGSDVERLPSASTCYNTLKLPTYKRSTTLKAKLRYAINSNVGFELS